MSGVGGKDSVDAARTPLLFSDFFVFPICNLRGASKCSSCL
jgi:hypothetical protein